MDTYRAFCYPDKELYERYEKQSKLQYNRICIDGSVTGCGNCVGYCQYEGHPGFLTSKHRTKQRCLEKGCFYYIPKPAHDTSKKERLEAKKQVLAMAQKITKDLEGLKVIDVVEDNDIGWKINYITISNEYPILCLEKIMEEKIKGKISFVKLGYSFDTCVHLIFDVCI